MAAVAAAVRKKKNQRLTVQELAFMLDLTFATVQSTPTVNLGLVKKVCPLDVQVTVHGPKR